MARTSLFGRGVLFIGIASVSAGCGDDGNPSGEDGSIYTGTGGEDDVGESGGTDGGLECYPEWEGDGDGDPVEYTCAGEGWGWADIDINPSVKRYACADSSVSNPSPENCAAAPIDFDDIDLLSDSVVSDPAACCMDTAAEGDIDYACLRDCSFAACKLASAKLREAANALPNDPNVADWIENNTKADLLWIANHFDNSPQALVECAGLVRAAAPQIVAYNMGGGPGSLIPAIGHVEGVKIFLGCDVDPGMAISGGTCETSANTPEDLDPAQSMIAFNNAVSFYGGYGEFVSSVVSSSYSAVAPTCQTEPCDFSLRVFDLEIADITVGDFVFEDVTVSLPSTITGSRTGSSVEFPAGDFDVEISVKVKVDGHYLFGAGPFVFSVSNTDVVYATWASNVFTIQDAAFEVGVVTALLNTDPPT